MGAVESSRRTIIVLSVGYVQSLWTRLEFQAAHAKGLKEKMQVGSNIPFAQYTPFSN